GVLEVGPRALLVPDVAAALRPPSTEPQPPSTQGWTSVPAVFRVAPSRVEPVPTALAAPVVAPVVRPVVGNRSDIPAPVQTGAGRAIVVHDIRKPVLDVTNEPPAQPAVEPIIVTIQEAAGHETPAPLCEAGADAGLDWLAGLGGHESRGGGRAWGGGG